MKLFILNPMNTQDKNRLSAKIFIGCLLTSELKMHLNQSAIWKQVSIDHTGLIEVNFQHKDYLGRYLPVKQLSLKALRPIEQEIKHLVHTYCPEISMETFSIALFSQIFIT